MLDFLPAPLKGILAVLLILTNTLLFLPLLLLVALAKLIVAKCASFAVVSKQHRVT